MKKYVKMRKVVKSGWKNGKQELFEKLKCAEDVEKDAEIKPEGRMKKMPFRNREIYETVSKMW